MATDHGNRAKILKMLGALEAQVRNADALAKAIDRGIKSESFATYLDFRSKISEMMSLSAVIEKRIEEIIDLDMEDVGSKFTVLNILAITILVRCANNFFSTMLKKKYAPMGISNVLESEIRFLDTMRDKLSQPNYFERLDGRIFEDIDNVIAAIQSISEKSNTLEDFDA